VIRKKFSSSLPFLQPNNSGKREIIMNVLRKNVTRKNTGSGDYLIRQARGNSLLLTVVIIGIAALCLATFPVIANFGTTTLIAVAFSLIGAIFVMPAVLSLMGSLSEWLEHRKIPGSHDGGE
jgi:uncharacterized membrane protein YdfJ with MMPL/SSD domain